MPWCSVVVLEKSRVSPRPSQPNSTSRTFHADPSQTNLFLLPLSLWFLDEWPTPVLFPYLTSSQIRDNSSRPPGQLTETQRKGKTFLMKRSYTSSDIEALHFQTNLDICMVFAWFTCLSLQTSMLAELLDTICYFFFFFKPS